jgi:hypothetical protein
VESSIRENSIEFTIVLHHEPRNRYLDTSFWHFLIYQHQSCLLLNQIISLPNHRFQNQGPEYYPPLSVLISQSIYFPNIETTEVVHGYKVVKNIHYYC